MGDFFNRIGQERSLDFYAKRPASTGKRPISVSPAGVENALSRLLKKALCPFSLREKVSPSPLPLERVFFNSLLGLHQLHRKEHVAHRCGH